MKSPINHHFSWQTTIKNQHFCWWYAVLCRPWTFLQPPWWFQGLLCRDLFELWHDVCVSFLFSVSVIWNLVVGIYTKYTNSGQLSKRMENARWRWLFTKNGQVMHPPEVEELPNPAHVHLAPVESWKSRGSNKNNNILKHFDVHRGCIPIFHPSNRHSLTLLPWAGHRFGAMAGEEAAQGGLIKNWLWMPQFRPRKLVPHCSSGILCGVTTLYLPTPIPISWDHIQGKVVDHHQPL